MEFRRVVVGSRNPIKLAAVESAYQAMIGERANFESIESCSEVKDQPMSDSETLKGANNRAHNAKLLVPNAQMWAGIEGGIEDSASGMHGFAWIVFMSPRLTSNARTATFPIPAMIAELVRSGIELGKADDIAFGKENSKQNAGAVGLLTDGVVDRFELYQHAAKLALIPFKNNRLF